MGDTLALFFTTFELLFFFAFDIFLARLLNTFKQDHPELDECAPEDAPDVDPVAIMHSLRNTVVEAYDQKNLRFGGNAAYSSIEAAVEVEPPQEQPLRVLRCSENVLHTVVVVCGLLAPALTVLQVLFAGAFWWCRIALPVWLQYVGVVPGLAAVVVFATRTVHFASFPEISRQQWILLMWFRLDFMCIASAVAFFGAGAWLVALCVLVTALYLAHRVMRMEKQLNFLARETQLVRGEVDLQHIYPPGTEQAKQALASSDVKGYSALV